MDVEILNNLSEELLLNVKMQKDTLRLQLRLEDVSKKRLQTQLINDDLKKAFWINIYNAYYQILRSEGYNKPEIYKKKLFIIAGKSISLDNVEHGILRRCKNKYSFGFFSDLLTPKFIKKNAVAKLDYRIHFALNCGAKSCPPIAFYNSDKINEQLDIATQSFLEGESIIDDIQKVVTTTTLFKWYYADFGKEKGIKNIFLNQLGKDISTYSVKYKVYSWEDDLSNFVP